MRAISRWITSCRHALRGMSQDFPREPNARIMLALSIVAIIMGFAMGISRIEWMMLVGCIGGVLGIEAMNSAIERCVDLACNDRNETARAAKDLAAAASLFVSLAAFIIGLLIFVPHIADLI